MFTGLLDLIIFLIYGDRKPINSLLVDQQPM